MHVFSTSFRTKVKFVDKMMQSNYLRVILHVKWKKIVDSHFFNLISNF